MHSDDEEVMFRRNQYSCLPWKRGPEKQAIIDSLRTKNESLTAIIDSLRTENESLTKERDRLQRDVHHLETEKTEREKEDKRREEEENKTREESWQEERQQNKKERDRLQRYVHQLETEKTEREKEDKKREKENKTREGRWQEERQQNQADRDTLQGQIDQLQTMLQAEKTAREKENKEWEKCWQQTQQQHQADRDTLQGQIDQLQTMLQAEKTAREKENKEWEKCWQQTQQQHQVEIRTLREDITAKTVEIRTLREDITAKTAQIADYKHRLSEMASERMRQGNACVEDLNDPFRPTALADKWTGLFKTGEYWTAYDKAQNTLKTDEATAQFLYNVTRTAWNVCFDFIEDLVPRIQVAGPCSSDLLSTESEKEVRQQMLEKLPEVRRKLEELLPQDASRVDKFVKTLEEEYNNVRKTDIPNLQQKLRKAVSLLPKTATPPALLAKKVAAAIHEEENSKNATVDENFIRKLTGLCYLMRLQEVPLSVNFDFTRGSPLDQSMFEVESSASQPPTDMAIKSILRPPLLRSAGGAVLSKGEADVEPAKPASDSATQDKVQCPGTTLGKQNGDETTEPKGNELDERKKEDESNQNEEGEDNATGSKDTSTDSSSKDGESDQDKPKENSANASQTSPDEHEEKSDEDEHEESSLRDKTEEASDANQNNARGSHADKNNVNDVSLD